MNRISPTRVQDERISLPAPPPYTSIVYKLPDQQTLDGSAPPSYEEVEGNLNITYINNYPGPPLDEDVVHRNSQISLNSIVPKKVRWFLLVNGFLALFFGCASIGIQIAIIVTNSILYYYYGFWGGALILSIGINTLVVAKQMRSLDYSKLLRSFVWQLIIMTIILMIGVIIITTDKCDDSQTDTNDPPGKCRESNRLLNGFLLATYGATILQTMINGVTFYILRNRSLNSSNSITA